MSDSIVDLTNIQPGLIVYITNPQQKEFFARATLSGVWTNSIGRGTSKLDALEKFLAAFNDHSSFFDA